MAIKTKNQHLYVAEDTNSKSLYIVFLGNGHNNKSSGGWEKCQRNSLKVLPIPIFGAKITNKKKKKEKTCL